MNVPDRNLLLALLDLTGALAHRLTGERPMVCLEDGDGNVVHLTLSEGNVQWFKDDAKATCGTHAEKWFKSRPTHETPAHRCSKSEVTSDFDRAAPLPAAERR